MGAIWSARDTASGLPNGTDNTETGAGMSAIRSAAGSAGSRGAREGDAIVTKIATVRNPARVRWKAGPDSDRRRHRWRDAGGLVGRKCVMECSLRGGRLLASATRCSWPRREKAPARYDSSSVLL